MCRFVEKCLYGNFTRTLHVVLDFCSVPLPHVIFGTAGRVYDTGGQMCVKGKTLVPQWRQKIPQMRCVYLDILERGGKCGEIYS